MFQAGWPSWVEERRRHSSCQILCGFLLLLLLPPTASGAASCFGSGHFPCGKTEWETVWYPQSCFETSFIFNPEPQGGSCCDHITAPVITGDTLGLEITSEFQDTEWLYSDMTPKQQLIIFVRARSADAASMKPGEFLITVNGTCVDDGVSPCSRTIRFIVKPDGDSETGGCGDCGNPPGPGSGPDPEKLQKLALLLRLKAQAQFKDGINLNGTSTIMKSGGSTTKTFLTGLASLVSKLKAGNFGTADPKSQGVSCDFNAGMGAFGSSSGCISIREPAPTNTLYTPSTLQYNFVTNFERVVIRDSASRLRQLKVPEGLINVFTNSALSYTADFYSAANVGAFSGGLYTFSGSPVQSVTISNPDVTGNTSNSVKIAESSGRTCIYEWHGSGWQLRDPNSLMIERRLETTNSSSATRTVITEMFQSTTNSPIACRMQTLKWFGSVERMTEEVLGVGAEAVTNYFSYSTNGYLERVIREDGSWEIFQNDTKGRPTNIFRAFLNQSPTNAASLTINIERDYTTNVVSGSGDMHSREDRLPRREIERVLGQETARRYWIYLPGETREIVCITPGAAWDNASNLVSITRAFTNNDAFFGRVHYRKAPDGVVELTSFATNSTGYLTNTTVVGEPDGTGTNIVQGRKKVSVFGPRSEGLSVSVFDVASGILVDSETYSEHDAEGRPRKTTFLDGTYAWTDFGCCGPITVTNRDGVVATFEKDALMRTTSTKVRGITLTNSADASGRVYEEVRISSSGEAISQIRRYFDSRGRVLKETNALNLITTMGETVTNYQRVSTITYADGSTATNRYYRDGKLERVTGTALHPVRYEYGVESEGGVQRYFQKTIKLDASGSDTSEWTKHYSDLAGRPYKTVLSDGATTQVFWNVKGQQVKTIDADGVVTLTQYNGEGEVEYTAVDQDRDDVIDFGGLDRIQRIQKAVTTAHGYNVLQTKAYAWATNNSAYSNLVSTAERSTDGLRTWDTSFGLTRTSVRTTPVNASWTVTTTEPDNSYSITLYQTGRLASVTRYDSNSVQIAKTSYGYDAHGRQHQATDARNGTTTQVFNNADQVTSVTTPLPGNGQAAQITSYEYDSRGRVAKTTYPDFTSLTNEYFLTGELKKTFGSRTYPVEYTYDSQGRMKTMKTWKDFAGNSGTATNTWNYDGYRGFLTNKVYPDGIGPSYTYTAGGKLKTRKWARNITTTYTTNSLGDIISIDYSDSTPDVTFTLDRQGRKTSITQGSDTTEFLYTEAGLPVSEKGTAGTLNGLTITNQYDTLMRRSSVKAMITSPSTTLSSATYGYDAASRLLGVTNGNYSVNYAYLANSPLVNQLTFRESTTTRMTTTKSYDYLNRLLSISSTAGSSVISSHGYVYNDADQRTRVDLVDGSYWIYEYDKLGQVIAGRRYWADGSVVAGQQFDYAFDDIGSRSSTKAGGDANGLNQRSATYSANNLNQYTSRTVPAQVNVSGIAHPASTVTVNSQSTSRNGEYYWGEATANNASAADFLSITSLSVFGTTNNSSTGYVFVPKTSEAFSYDADGNLTNDGRWVYTWDAENRLIQVESQTTAPSASKRKITYNYDYQSRLVARKSYTNNGSYQIKSDTKYLNDGWRCLAEVNATNNNVIRGYVWGRDLSGSLEGAGGIGGLLMLTDAATSTSHFYAYDGNGNVSALAKTSDSSKTAHYEYGPFGEVTRASGTIAKSNPVRFSTKAQDEESDLLYYGYRFYNASTGRWPSRDPLFELGFTMLSFTHGRQTFSPDLNLYEFAHNDPLGHYDILGAAVCACSVPSELGPFVVPVENVTQIGFPGDWEAPPGFIGPPWYPPCDRGSAGVFYKMSWVANCVDDNPILSSWCGCWSKKCKVTKEYMCGWFPPGTMGLIGGGYGFIHTGTTRSSCR